MEEDVVRGREMVRNLAEDRKNDIEETARYIKTIVGSTKNDIV